MRLMILTTAAVLVALGASASRVPAGEICIRCTAPEQTYRCTVLGDAAPADHRRRAFYCASRIAQDEDHATCAAVRRETQCQGAPRSYVYDASTPLPAPLTDEPADGDATQAGREVEKKGPPETVVDLTRETARQTEESLEEAAEQTVETTRGLGERVRDAAGEAAGAVDRATRATIRCIGSLFDDC